MRTQVAIIGCGPAGTSVAISLQEHGIECVMIEKKQFPRFHIGESMTGECGASVRALGVEAKMKESNYPIKWGAKMYGKGGQNAFYVPVMKRDKMGKLVKQSTWQVRRSDFDKMLLDASRERGLKIIDAEVDNVIRNEDGSLNGLIYSTKDGKEHKVYADVIVDCSGLNTFLANKKITSKKERGVYDNQIAIFSHFKGCVRPKPLEDEELMPDDTLLFYLKKHHWAWFIPLDGDTVSIGIVTPTSYYKSKNETKQEFLLGEMKSLNPKLAERVLDAELVEDVHACSNYSYQIHDFTGKNWLCIGDAHRFIDPIFSLGLHFSMSEGRKAVKVISDYLDGKSADMDAPFLAHQNECERGMDVIQDLLDAFWDYPLAFSLYMKDKKYSDDLIDMFAGRVYDIEPSEGLKVLRRLNQKEHLNAAV